MYSWEWQDYLIGIVALITIYFLNRHIRFFSFERKVLTWVAIFGYLSTFVIWLIISTFCSTTRDMISYVHDAKLLNQHIIHYSDFTTKIWLSWEFNPQSQASNHTLDEPKYGQNGFAFFYSKILAVLLWGTAHSIVVLWFLLVMVCCRIHIEFIFWLSNRYFGNVFLWQIVLLLWPSLFVFSTDLNKELMLWPAFLICWMDSDYFMVSRRPVLGNFYRFSRWLVSAFLLIIIKLYLFVALWGILCFYYAVRFLVFQKTILWRYFLLISIPLACFLYSKQFTFFYTIHQAYSTRQSVLGNECKLEQSSNTIKTPNFEVSYRGFWERFPQSVLITFPGYFPWQVNSTWLKFLCTENILLVAYLGIMLFLIMRYLPGKQLDDNSLLFLSLIIFGIVYGGYLGLSVANVGGLMRYRIYALLPLLAGLTGLANQSLFTTYKR